MLPKLSVVKPLGELYATEVPIPLLMDGIPLPDRVATDHTQYGCSVRPEELHSEGVSQGMAGAGVPPGQKKPTWQSLGTELVDPAGQPFPGAEVQSPEHAGTARLVEEPNVPAGHWIGARDPAGQ